MTSPGRIFGEQVHPLGWVILLVLTAGLVVAARGVGIPSPEILAAIVAGTAVALSGRGPRRVPPPLAVAGQAVMGTALGAMVTSQELRALAADWVGVLVVTVLTLVISFGSGFLLALHPAVDRVTGVLSMAAGGASGLVAVAGDLGGDIRMVGTLQYTRVLLITASTPPIAAYVFGAPAAAVPAGPSDGAGGVLVGIGCTIVGLLVGRVVRVPAGDLLGPMVVTAAVAIWGGVPAPALPGVVVAVAYVVIGWTATLGFTRAALGTVVRVLPLSLGLVFVLMVVSAVAGVWLARLAGLPDLDGYLATTPGGMMAVLAVAAASGGNVTFITGVQAVRLFLMLALTPLLTGWLHRHAGPASSAPSGRGSD